MFVPKIFGVPRSGSTVIYNIVDYLYGGCVAPQKHDYFEDVAGMYMTIVTYRDFRDSCTSQWRAFHAGFDEEKDRLQIPRQELITHATNQLTTVEYLNRFKVDSERGRDVLFLRYEEFFDNVKGDLNFDFIFKNLQEFLNIEITEDQRAYIKKNFAFKSQKEYSKQYKNFHDYCDSRHIHGHHLYKGKTGTWRELVAEEHHVILNHILKDSLLEWGYK
tara:strand:- start:1071 stop:1724 length:654 start_codon:yes stop_codon:yes gene_type:complete